MTGPTHGAMALTTAVGYSTAAGSGTLGTLLTMVFALVGAYLLDIDHHRSTITRLVPGVGPLVSWLVRLKSRLVYLLTHTKRTGLRGTHRFLTHTLAFCGAVGWLTGWWAQNVATSIGADDPARVGWLVGVGLTLGCAAHAAGDAMTDQGAPLLWPIPVRGQVWYPVRLLPGPFRITTGGGGEKVVVVLTLAVGVVVSPWVWPTAAPVLTDGWTAVRALRG